MEVGGYTVRKVSVVPLTAVRLSTAASASPAVEMPVEASVTATSRLWPEVRGSLTPVLQAMPWPPRVSQTRTGGESAWSSPEEPAALV